MSDSGAAPYVNIVSEGKQLSDGKSIYGSKGEGVVKGQTGETVVVSRPAPGQNVEIQADVLAAHGI